MNIKPLPDIQAKWKERAAAATGAYEDGVKSPRRSWAAAAIAAKENYEAGIRRSIAANSFSKGVHRAGNAKWQDRAIRLGVRRFPEGVAESEESYSKGFGPYHTALSALALPLRYARQDDRNMARVDAIRKALIAVKNKLG